MSCYELRGSSGGAGGGGCRAPHNFCVAPRTDFLFKGAHLELQPLMQGCFFFFLGGGGVGGVSSGSCSPPIPLSARHRLVACCSLWRCMHARFFYRSDLKCNFLTRHLSNIYMSHYLLQGTNKSTTFKLCLGCHCVYGTTAGCR